MDLLNRYLQAVGQYLPAKGREDMLAELRANLLAEMEGREEELGRPLTDAEVASVLEEHGRPILVAARYLPQQYLIGPGLFPIYWITLKRSFPVMLLIYLATQAAFMVFGGLERFSLLASIGRLPGALLTFLSVMTLGFAAFEWMQGRYFDAVKLSTRWNVNELPKVSRAAKGPSLAARVADAIITALAGAWLLSIPYLSWVFIGPGVKNLRGLPVGLTPEWHIFYWQLVGMMMASLVLKVVLIVEWPDRIRQVLQLAVQLFGILGMVVLVQARSYFVPASALTTHNLDVLMTINMSVNFGFKIVLAICVLQFLWSLWKMMMETEAPRAGCALV